MFNGNFNYIPNQVQPQIFPQVQPFESQVQPQIMPLLPQSPNQVNNGYNGSQSIFLPQLQFQSFQLPQAQPQILPQVPEFQPFQSQVQPQMIPQVPQNNTLTNFGTFNGYNEDISYALSYDPRYEVRLNQEEKERQRRLREQEQIRANQLRMGQPNSFQNIGSYNGMDDISTYLSYDPKYEIRAKQQEEYRRLKERQEEQIRANKDLVNQININKTTRRY